ncbi:MAG: hypothetical protein C4519_16265 [Desulfobacteraceae bacterium]|nr:MAG: hypothetical protein C4519_16265 [Desulfobacteraceae bacterium]
MFTLADIRFIAIQIERNGEAVYLKASQRAADPQVAGLLEHMAEQENAHARWFAQLDVGRPFTPKDRQIHDLGRDLLKSMMAQQTFSLDENRLSAATELKEVLNQSLELEEDTILFYEMLYSFLDHSETMLQLERIINEERSHIDQLNEMNKMLNSADRDTSI